MKLFLIVWAAGAVQGMAGPLPYEMEKCEEYARGLFRDMHVQLQGGFYADGTPIRENPGMAKNARTIRFTCEYRAERPEIGEKAK